MDDFKPTLVDKVCMMYTLISSNNMGNTMWSDREEEWLKQTKDILIEIHGHDDFRVRFLLACIVKRETGELSTQDVEWIRYILHAEYEPEFPHTIQMEEIEQRMNETGTFTKYPKPKP